MFSGLKQKVKALTSTHFWLRYGTLAAYRALCAGILTLTGRTSSGAAHAQHSTEEAVHYITNVFNNYKAAAKIERFHGRIAEIGPGDSCGVGLMFLADGCSEVHLVDRFYSRRDEEQQRAINQALVRQFPQLASHGEYGDFVETSFEQLHRYYGNHAEAETFFQFHTGYDFIVSCAVLEHLYDPLRAIGATASALNPGGMLLHQVDCRDHSQFSGYFHELKFLELSPSLYSPLKWGGGPNRVRVDSYAETLERLGMNFKIYVTSLAGVPELIYPYTVLEDIPETLLETSRRFVSAIRPHLAKPFREMSDANLMVSGFMLVAKQPGSADAGGTACASDGSG